MLGPHRAWLRQAVFTVKALEPLLSVLTEGHFANELYWLSILLFVFAGYDHSVGAENKWKPNVWFRGLGAWNRELAPRCPFLRVRSI